MDGVWYLDDDGRLVLRAAGRDDGVLKREEWETDFRMGDSSTGEGGRL